MKPIRAYLHPARPEFEGDPLIGKLWRTKGCPTDEEILVIPAAQLPTPARVEALLEIATDLRERAATMYDATNPAVRELLYAAARIEAFIARTAEWYVINPPRRASRGVA